MSISISGDGSITGVSTSYTFDKSVSIAGTVSYEDVTSIDAVGIITAQSGIHIDDSIVHLGDTNTKIRFPAADTVTIETGGTEALRVGSDQKVYFGDFASAGSKAYIEKEVSGDYKFNIHASSSTAQNRIITFNSREDVEAMRLDASGRLAIGTTTPETTGALTVSMSDTNEKYLSLINRQNWGYGVGIDFMQPLASGGSVIKSGKILSDWESANNSLLSFYTTGSGTLAERLRITSTGKCEVYKGTSTTGKTSGSEAFTVGNGGGNHRFAVYPDGTTVIGGTGDIGNNNIQLTNNGNATFAGTIISQANPEASDTTNGAMLDKVKVVVRNAAGQSVWLGYKNGTSGATSSINVDGDTTIRDLTVRTVTSSDQVISNRSGTSVCFRAQSSGTDNFTVQADGKVTATDIEVSDSSPTVEINASGNGQPTIELQQSGTAYAKFLFDGNHVQFGNFYSGGATKLYGGNDERIRINSNGRVDVGDELGVSHAGQFQVIHTGGGQQDNDCLAFFETNANDWCIITNSNEPGNNSHYHIYFYESGSGRGRIFGLYGQNVQYATGSDYRWKENIVEMTGTEGIDICKKLKPSKFNWIKNREGTGKINTVDGFIAHEVEEAGVLGAVSGEKDAVNEDGSIDGQMLDYGQMTPVLAAAIKGLIAKVETLETQNADLLSRVTVLEG